MKTSSGSWPSSPGRETRTCIQERAHCIRTCIHMSLSGHAVERWLAVITRNSRQSWYISTQANLSQHKSSWTRSLVHGESVARQIKTPQILICGATNLNFSREKFALALISTFTLYGILSPPRVWWERTVRQRDIQIFTQKEKIASKRTYKHAYQGYSQKVSWYMQVGLTPQG